MLHDMYILPVSITHFRQNVTYSRFALSASIISAIQVVKKGSEAEISGIWRHASTLT
jgi:hypothetical protein